MRQKSHSTELSSEQLVKGIRRATREGYSTDEKIRIVLDGLRGEQSIAPFGRRASPPLAEPVSLMPPGSSIPRSVMR